MGRRLTPDRAMKRLSRIARKQFFNDSAFYYDASVTDGVALDDYGQPTTDPEDGTGVLFKCSFVDSTTEARKWLDADVEVQHIDALIRFGRDITPEKGGRIKLRGRFGTNNDYGAEVFEIVNIRDRDAFGYVCGLRRATV